MLLNVRNTEKQKLAVASNSRNVNRKVIYIKGADKELSALFYLKGGSFLIKAGGKKKKESMCKATTKSKQARKKGIERTKKKKKEKRKREKREKG